MTSSSAAVLSPVLEAPVAPTQFTPGAAPASPVDPAEAVPVIEFVAPMPGFPGRTRFALVAVEESGLVFSLRSLEDSALRFLTVAPHGFFPDYAPEIDDETAAALGTTDPDHLLVLLVVTAGDTPAGSTANLLAPLIVDQRTRRAAQVVLTGTELPVRAPLIAA